MCRARLRRCMCTCVRRESMSSMVTSSLSMRRTVSIARRRMCWGRGGRRARAAQARNIGGCDGAVLQMPVQLGVSRTFGISTIAMIAILAASSSACGLFEPDHKQAERLRDERAAWGRLAIHDYEFHLEVG